MSRFIVTTGSDYRPFSYDELVKPLQQSAQVHSAAADAYDTLSMETEALGRYISENEGDREAKALYDSYVKKLGDLQENLWSKGFTSQTRRDLSGARAMYAKDVQRLKNAIQTRQERSKEYWDARHKNPDLISGFDPGVGGLDNYMRDSEYGRNWYSYSGNQFASEVGAEAKARAGELLQSYAGKSDIPGYIEYIQKNGFSNAQVNEAGALAKAVLSGQANLEDANDPASAVLAGVLLSRLQATGANPGENGNLSAEEFDRMFNYGMLGLAQGIGDVNSKLIDDKIFDQQQRMKLAAYQSGLKQMLEAIKHGGAGNGGVHREAVDVSLTSKNAARDESRLRNIYDSELFADGKTVPLQLPDGSSIELASRDDARKMLLSERAKKFLETTGIDVRKENSGFFGRKDEKQKWTYNNQEFMAEKAPLWERWSRKNIRQGDVLVKRNVGGKWQYDAQMTDVYNRALREQNEYERQIEELNPGRTINGLGLSTSEIKQLRRREGIPAGVPDDDVPYVVQSKIYNDRYSGVPIIGTGQEDDDLRERLSRAILHSVLDGSKYGFYSIGDDNMTLSKIKLDKKGGIGSIFPIDKDGNIKPGAINQIFVTPHDVNNGEVNVRIETSNGNKIMTNIANLGNDLESAGNPKVASLIQTMMLPISGNVADLFDVNVNAGEGWDEFMYKFLLNAKDSYGNPCNYDVPTYMGYDGKMHIATAKMVARNDFMKEHLLNGINAYLRDVIAFGIDPNSLYPRRHVNYTSKDATDTENGEL